VKHLWAIALALVLLLSIASIASADQYVRGYVRRDGTYVQPYMRSTPDSNPYNNYSFPGNTNPYTGQVAPGNSDSYLERYYQQQNPKPLNSPWGNYGR
jgi:opacity protein-like surface antigen